MAASDIVGGPLAMTADGTGGILVPAAAGVRWGAAPPSPRFTGLFRGGIMEVGRRPGGFFHSTSHTPSLLGCGRGFPTFFAATPGQMSPWNAPNASAGRHAISFPGRTQER